MLSFQSINDALEQDEINQTLSTYALLTKSGLASKTIFEETAKYPAANEMIAILDHANILNVNNRHVFIDLLFACKTITTRKDGNPPEEFSALIGILHMMKNTNQLTAGICLKMFGELANSNVYQVIEKNMIRM